MPSSARGRGQKWQPPRAAARASFPCHPRPLQGAGQIHRDRQMTASPEVQARILIEALPHMQQYDEEIVVVKYGGHAMGNEAMARSFAQDIVLLEQTAINPGGVPGGW